MPMDGRWVRVIAALVAFVIATAVGILAFGRFDTAPDPTTFFNQVTADSWALILTIAMIVAAVVYFGLEKLQTGRLESLEREFSTRTIALMPIGIALNIVLGAAVANALKIPIYLDSIGTILVGVLCGPIAGAFTGALTNILWSYIIPPPFQSSAAAAFAITAVAIGVIAGLAGRAGLLRPRPNQPPERLAAGGAVTIGLILLMSYLAFLGYQKIIGQAALAPSSDNTLLVILGWVALGLVVATVVGLIALLVVRRDLTAAYVVGLGVLTGIVAALISAPIAAGVYSGVTGAGTDFLVAAFRQAGADVQAATLGQGLISDPIDKVTTFFVVYLIVSAMARRTKARFPQGEQLLEEGTAAADEGEWRGAPA
jgi:energy-coupling factor transport system substrate-specific component